MVSMKCWQMLGQVFTASTVFHSCRSVSNIFEVTYLVSVMGIAIMFIHKEKLLMECQKNAYSSDM
jgi:hypothetical protein